MAGNKPTAAMVLCIIGGVLILIGGLLLSVIGSAFGSMVNLGGLGSLVGVIGIIFGIIIIISGVMMNTTNVAKVKKWGIVALILAIISLINGGGFILGFILALVGGILALTYKG